MLKVSRLYKSQDKFYTSIHRFFNFLNPLLHLIPLIERPLSFKEGGVRISEHMMFKKNYLIPLCLLMCEIAWATSQTTLFPSSSRELFFATGSSSIGIFGGEEMLPIYGNKEGFLFGDMMGDYGTNETFLISPGGGFRKVVSNHIIGGYFFGDYEKTNIGTHFWVLSPGVEWITTRWDVHVNGYFPTTTKQQSGSQEFLNILGDSSHLYFQSGTHNQYDEQVTPYAVIGDGADAELGYSFSSKDNLRSRVYMGMYYYQPPNYEDMENITGFTVGFEQSVSNNMTIAVRNSYDGLSHYNVGISLLVTFGGKSNLFTNNVRDRLFDPIQRHVGIIGTGAGTYDQQYLENNGTALEYDNVYFIATDGTGDGTYGSSASLTQSTLDEANIESVDGARLYLQGGENSIYYVNKDTASAAIPQATAYSTPSNGLMVYANQSFYGRSTDYTAPASSNELPHIEVDAANNYNGFVIQGGGEHTFSDLTITEYSSSHGIYPTSGITATNNTEEDLTLNIINTNIIGMDRYGVYAKNNNIANFTINAFNSQFNDNGVMNDARNELDSNIAGMYAENNSSGDLVINAIHSQFNGNGVVNAFNNGTNKNISGLEADNNDTGTLAILAKNSQFNGNGVFNGRRSGAGGKISGMDAENNGRGTFTIKTLDSQFNGNGVLNSAHTGVSTAAGINALNKNEGTYTIHAVNSQFNGNGVMNGNQNGMDIAAGIEANNNAGGTLTITTVNSEFNSNGAINGDGSGMGKAAGLDSVNNGDGTFNISAKNSEFDNNGIIHGDESGMGMAAGMTVINQSSGTFNLNTINDQFIGNGEVSVEDSGIGITQGLYILNAADGTIVS